MRLSYILCHSFKSFHAKPSEFCIHLSPEAQSISEVFGVFTSERCQGTRMFLLSIVAVCIEDGHDCITASSGIYTTTHE